jgi:Phage-related lysozyme (muraminidase)
MSRDVRELIAEALPLLVGLCVRFEGVYLRPYLCPAGVPTLGVGTTRYLDGRPVLLTDPPITRETAMVLLRHQLRATYIPGALNAVPVIDTPGRLAALADFAYNCGVGALRASTLRRRALAGRWDDVPAELRRWTRGGGRQLPGLVRRREAEIALL